MTATVEHMLSTCQLQSLTTSKYTLTPPHSDTGLLGLSGAVKHVTKWPALVEVCTLQVLLVHDCDYY